MAVPVVAWFVEFSMKGNINRKTILILYPSLKNSTTGIAIMAITYINPIFQIAVSKQGKVKDYS